MEVAVVSCRKGRTVDNVKRLTCDANTPTSTSNHRITLPSKPLLKNTATTMDKLDAPQTGDSEPPVVTVHPVLASQSHLSSLKPHLVRTSASPFPIIQGQSPPPHSTERGGSPVSLPDLMPHLHRSAPSIVKTRSGSVLSRGFILKTDHYPSGESPICLSAFHRPAYRAGTRS